MMGFENNLGTNNNHDKTMDLKIIWAQIIIMTRRCVANKNYVARLKVKVTVGTSTLCIDFSETCSCLTHNFIMHGWIWK